MLPPSSPAGSLAPALPANPSRRGGPRPGAPAARRGVRVGGRGRPGAGVGPGEGRERGRRGPGSGHREGGGARPRRSGARPPRPHPRVPPPRRGPAPGPRAALGHSPEVAWGWRGRGGEGCPALGEARGGGGRADDRREGVRAQRKSPEDREDGGGRCGRGGGGPSPPSRGVTLARPPAAPGGGEGGRNASPQALISPPSPVSGTRGQRPAGRGPGSGLGRRKPGFEAGIRPSLPFHAGRVSPRLALGLSFPHSGIRTRSGREQSGLPLGPSLGPSSWDNLRSQPERCGGPWSRGARRSRLGGGKSGCRRV